MADVEFQRHECRLLIAVADRDPEAAAAHVIEVLKEAAARLEAGDFKDGEGGWNISLRKGVAPAGDEMLTYLSSLSVIVPEDDGGPESEVFAVLLTEVPE